MIYCSSPWLCVSVSEVGSCIPYAFKTSIVFRGSVCAFHMAGRNGGIVHNYNSFIVRLWTNL